MEQLVRLVFGHKIRAAAKGASLQIAGNRKNAQIKTDTGSPRELN